MLSKKQVRSMVDSLMAETGKSQEAISKHLTYGGTYISEVLTPSGVITEKFEAKLRQYYESVFKEQSGSKEELLRDVYERLERIDSHLEVYESAIAEVLSKNKGDFTKRVAELRERVQEAVNRRFSELKRK